jgi:hypothetical protein
VALPLVVKLAIAFCLTQVGMFGTTICLQLADNA